MKIALVHDYLSEYGGAERVVEALPQYNAYPDVTSGGACTGLRPNVIL